MSKEIFETENPKYRESDFTQEQIREINEGKAAGLEVGIYARPELLAIQMRQIRLGLQEKLPIEKYADIAYDWFQMEEIRKGLQKGLKVEKYADPAVPYDTMRQIRKGLLQGLDLSAAAGLPAGILRELRKSLLSGVNIVDYIKEGYEKEQLEQIRLALEKGVDIGPYLSKSYRGASIREICAGLESKVEVSLYARPDISWQQMREIRLGLEERLAVEHFINPLYSWQQMREIRLGLEEGLPVESYSSLMYTAGEMKRKREALIGARQKADESRQAGESFYEGFSVVVSPDEMEARIVFSRKETKIDRNQLLLALSESGVSSGIDETAIQQIVHGQYTGDSAVIAKGRFPQNGKDGWYEYFFRTGLKRQPKLLEDGSVDYQNTEWFEIVHTGQKLACYHAAGEGQDGITVTGRRLPAKKGREQKLLSGRGFLLSSDKTTYVAAMDGKIDVKENRMEISNLLVLEEVTMATGNIDFNGSVYVRGTVGIGTVVKATQDILVDGFVESAVIEAGGDVILRKGNNAAGQGHIRAGRDVLGKFFESANIVAGGSIRANYCLNCEMSSGGWITIQGQRGVLAGGRVYAVRGLRSHQLGNSAGLVTDLKLGSRAGFRAEEAALLKREKEIEQELFLLKNAYFDFHHKYPAKIRNENPTYLKLENAIYTKETEMGELLKRKQLLEEEKLQFNQAKAVIKGTLFEGVSVEINGCKWSAKQASNIILKKQADRIAVYR